MNKKQKYILIVIGVYLVYCLAVYLIRRNMGISSTFEDVLEYQRYVKTREELKAEKLALIQGAGEQTGPRDLTDLLEGPNRAI